MEELLENAVNDGCLGFFEIGILASIQVRGPIQKNLLSGPEREFADRLVEYQYILADDEKYFIPGTELDDAHYRNMWKVFYKAYPGGGKLGEKTMWDKFKKKYPKGKWKTIVVTLEDRLFKQIKDREIKANAIAIQDAIGNRKHQMFLAPWKNLGTYINNTGWEEEFLTPEEFIPAQTVSINVESMDPEYRRYFQWALVEGQKTHKNAGVVVGYMLTEVEYFDIVLGKRIPFKSFAVFTTLGNLKQSIVRWQQSWFTSVFLRSQHSSFFEYCADSFKKEFKNQ